MKYLAYFQPNESLSETIAQHNYVDLVSSELHTTLCFFHMRSSYEEQLIDTLSDIDFPSFEIKTVGFAAFDNDALVLKISLSEELLQLHREILSTIHHYTNEESKRATQYYFGDNYTPHITIGKSSSQLVVNSNELLNQKSVITKYMVAKKIDGHWRDIQTFSASNI